MKVNGEYIIVYKLPNEYIDEGNFLEFTGFCRYFTTNGRCAFYNEKDEWLIVDYSHIIQMRLNG